MIYSDTLSTELGVIRIEANESAITRIGFVEISDFQEQTSACDLTELAKTQLSEYFSNARKVFDLPLFFGNSSDFNVEVWKEVLSIPKGQTISYLDLALKLGNKKKTRAVARANALNPFLIIIPCHRVIGKNNDLTGYAAGLHRKKWLLDFEANVIQTTLIFEHE
ncbi:MAG: methylated-DNA--[protein]-cysteine S-methyltransferase [Flavobacteriales bacterium]|nr:methylated-DNA--[protein]-cysteine S-methyltransferase [Flavobacteriales bacterium]